ncbi:MAG: hypothetical protein ABIB98_00990 [bacterium]
MNRILWVSRQHEPTSRQKASLVRIYGEDVEILRYKETFSSADQIAIRYRKEKCTALVFVGPESALRRLVELPDVVVVRAIPREVREGEVPDFVDRKSGTRLVFNGFEQVDKIEVKTTLL